MRNDLKSSPGAAELYFNHSIFGHLYTLIAELLSQRPEPAARKAEATDERPTLLDRIDGWFWRQRQQDQESWLAESRDAFELERRIEALERGVQPRLEFV